MNAPAPSRDWRDWMALAIRFFLAAIFAFAAAPKIVDPAAFAEAVYRYHLLPDGLVNIAAVYLPWLEVVCAVALVVAAPLRRGALLSVAAMLVLFIGAMGINLYRGVDIACGCFSVAGGESLSWINMARNIGLLVLVALAWHWDPRAKARIS